MAAQFPVLSQNKNTKNWGLTTGNILANFRDPANGFRRPRTGVE